MTVSDSRRSAFASPGCWVAPQQAQASTSVFSRHLEPMAVSLHCSFSSLHWDPSLNHCCLHFLAHSALGAEQLLMRWRLFKTWFQVEMCMTMSWDSWVAEIERTAPGSLLGLNRVNISDSEGVASSPLESVSSEDWLKELLMKILTSQTYWIKNSRVGRGSFSSFYLLLLLYVCLCMCVCVHVCVPQHGGGGQRLALWSFFSPITFKRDPGNELELQGLYWLSHLTGPRNLA